VVASKKTYPFVLQTLEGVPHYDIIRCKQMMREISITKQICAGGIVGFDACRGDSGGPMWMNVDSNPVLYGVTSWGDGCAGARPGIYTRVAAYRDWIESTASISLANVYNGTVDLNSCDCESPDVAAYCYCPGVLGTDSCDCQSPNVSRYCSCAGNVYREPVEPVYNYYSVLSIVITCLLGVLVVGSVWFIIAWVFRWWRMKTEVELKKETVLPEMSIIV
jgi:hypothetical protein